MPTRWTLLAAFLYATFAPPQPALAHPLGNFTINHLAEVRPMRGGLHVKYVLDIAEIPTFQFMSAANAGGSWSPEQMRAWAQNEDAIVLAGFHITSNGAPVVLEPLGANARLRPGAGGLPILYWTGEFAGRVDPSRAQHVEIDDGVYADRRIGWKDVVVAPHTEPTHELRSYPSVLIGSPRQITGVAFRLAPDGRASQVTAISGVPVDGGAPASLARSTVLSDMFARPNQTPLFIALTILAAFGLGALHAIEPGHGKALLAFTLVGARATTRQALILAAALTFAHTIGVFVLGFALFAFSGFISENVYPLITLVSGVAVAVIGARAIARYVASRARHEHVHEHTHDGAHPHDHVHAHGGAESHGHSHAVSGTQPLHFRAAVVAAMSGGVAPCPAAIVVMLAALRLHQIGYGMLLIVVFSLGLAAILSGLGIAVVHGAGWISRRSRLDTLVAYGPLASGILISIVGAAMVGQGFVQDGVRAPALTISALTLLAIAGYALAPRHAHGHSHRAPGAAEHS